MLYAVSDLSYRECAYWRKPALGRLEVGTQHADAAMLKFPPFRSSIYLDYRSLVLVLLCSFRVDATS